MTMASVSVALFYIFLFSFSCYSYALSLGPELTNRAPPIQILTNHTVHKTVSMTIAEINAGPEGHARKTYISRMPAGTKLRLENIPGDVPVSVFKTTRYGWDFSYNFDVSVGTYEIDLGIVEWTKYYCGGPGLRIFSVYVNNEVHLESFDIVKECNGCFKPRLITIPSAFSVGVTDSTGLTIRFRGILRAAQVSYVRVRKLTGQEKCIPESSSGESREDHVAHAVPGVYPTHTDVDEDGFAYVRIDGTSSHSHFFDVEKGIAGRIISYTWTLTETNVIISREAKFVYRFKMGITRLRLSVVDNSCSSHEAETIITVTGNLKKGQYCYFYDRLSSSNFALPVDQAEEKPFAARPFRSLTLNHKDIYSRAPPNKNVVVRCMFNANCSEITSISVNPGKTGTVHVYNGRALLIHSANGLTRSQEDMFPSGMNAFQVIYTYDSSSSLRPFLSVKSSDKNWRTEYDQRAVVPIIRQLDPAIGKPKGGAKIRIKGDGLLRPFSVYFGKTVASIAEIFSSREIAVYAPPMTESLVNVSVRTRTGLRSQYLSFTYSSDSCDSVNFEFRNLSIPDQKKNGKNKFSEKKPFIKLPTCVTLGPDNRLYIGSLGAKVHVVGYDGVTLRTKTWCHSLSYHNINFQGNDRKLSQYSILGIDFNPYEKNILPYVSTSALYRSKGKIATSNQDWWKNGGVHRYKLIANPDTFKFDNSQSERVCLVYDRPIVLNLPVSALDHGVNALLFTPKGDLLISVAGSTNIGRPHWKLGWGVESVLSAAVLIANIHVGLDKYDRNIKYSSSNPRLAKQVSGDVEVYASGFRNAFAMTMMQNGKIIAVDQGPNCGYGDWTVGCVDKYINSESNPSRFIETNESLTSSTRIAIPTPCPDQKMSLGRKDKILEVAQGAFYGHPNVQRKECEWVDPASGFTPSGKKGPSNYKPPLKLIDSSITGIREYRANHFCGAMQGDLILSEFEGQTVWRYRDKNNVETLKKEVNLRRAGGIQFVEDIFGNLIFLRMRQGTSNFTVLQPVVSAGPGMKAVGSWPRMIRRSGGTKVFIGGMGFNSSVRVAVGSSPCVVDMKLLSETQVTCTAPGFPKGDGISHVKDLVVVQGGSKTVLNDALRYTT